MSLADFVRGRHLQQFQCELCGPVEHDSAIQIGEVLVCWPCVCRVVMSQTVREADDCQLCWPQGCVACPGVVLHSGDEHRAHVNLVHSES